MKILPLCLLAVSLLPLAGQGAIIVTAPPAETGETKHIDVQKPKEDAGRESTAVPQTDVLNFLNRDSLHGSLLMIDPQTGVRWQSPEAKAPIDFNMAKLAEIKLAAGPNKPPMPNDISGILLTNDDELEGTVISLDSDKLELDTWYAGKLTIPRAMIKSITPRRQSAASVYEGPAGMDGWITGNQENAWKYRDGSFYTHNNGMLGRDFKLPNLSDTEFDMAWAGYLQIVISIYTDQPDRYGGNSYMLQMNNNYVSLERMRRNSGSSNMGQTELQSLMQRSKAHIGIRVNKDTKTISLLVNGQLAKQWTDRGDFVGGGGGISFYSQGRGLIKISKIKITSWDGKFEEPSKPGDKSTEDVLKLENGDKVSGALKEIAKGNAALASTYATLNVPVDRIEEIDMAGKNADEAKRRGGDVRAYFAGRGMVTLSIEKWDGKELIGNSPNFGRATFKAEAFTRLQFNLDSPTPGGDDTDDPDSDSDSSLNSGPVFGGVPGMIRVIRRRAIIND